MATMTPSAALIARVSVCMALIVISVVLHCPVEAACQSCLLPFSVVAGRHQHRLHHRPANKGRVSWSFGAFAATRQIISILDSRHRRFLESSDETDEDQTTDAADAAAGGEQARDVSEVEATAAVVSAIGFYKKFISPLLPPACRFLPTCSQYGVQAFEQFGLQKGAILTAWRLLRCSPFGGRGYDPPKWPPVAYNYGSY